VDFFGAQDRARRKTWQLTALFAAAVVALILATNVLIAIVAAFSTTPGMAMGFEGAIANTSTSTWVGISALVVFVIAAASLYKYFIVRAGGRAVAEMLDAKQIEPSTTDLAERRTLNVVEEMAIAAGIPVPPVYLIEEDAINAFAAGLGTDDAIIGVTRGTITHLDRDELQGVVGHEFSHLLNGDSRINLRLIALLHGILFLGIVGEMVLRGGRGMSRSNRRGGGGGGAVLVLGVGLLAIGYAGTFFGNLIKAAVSRQREFLADAAAVQFTRNPGGIANALKKIGGSTQGSRLHAAHTREVSHLFFGQAVGFFMNRLFATHPPLASRIRAVEPRWDGRFIDTGAASAMPSPGADVAAMAATSTDAVHDVVLDQVGSPDTGHLDVAPARIGSLTPAQLDAAHDHATAYALVHALFLSDDPDIRDRQLNALRIAESEATVRQILTLSVAGLDALQRLTLVAVAIPALKAISHSQYQRLVSNMLDLVRADQRIDLNEWVLHRVLLKGLAPHFGGAPRPARRTLPPTTEFAAASTVLSAMAKTGHGDAAEAFATGAAVFDAALTFDGADDPNFSALNDALRALRALPPLAKPRHIKAYAACALSDGATAEQRALLAGIAATLDCPLPPDFRIPGT
jgi:Zn-dependent protease with chaperone function